MNTELMFSSKDMTWETPKEIFNELNKEFNFSLDPCCEINTAKCNKFYTSKENGLIQDWQGENVFVNPPYGREIVEWVKKSYNTIYNQIHNGLVVMLIPARTDTKWFHEYIYGKAEIRFLKGRIKFLQDGKQKDAAPFPSMIVIFKTNQHERQH